VREDAETCMYTHTCVRACVNVCVFGIHFRDALRVGERDALLFVLRIHSSYRAMRQPTDMAFTAGVSFKSAQHRLVGWSSSSCLAKLGTCNFEPSSS